jgi:hypothetical protein
MLFCCNLETWGVVLLFDNSNSHDIGNPKTLNLEDNLSLKLVYISLHNNDGGGPCGRVWVSSAPTRRGAKHVTPIILSSSSPIRALGFRDEFNSNHVS